MEWFCPGPLTRDAALLGDDLGPLSSSASIIHMSLVCLEYPLLLFQNGEWQ